MKALILIAASLFMFSAWACEMTTGNGMKPLTPQVSKLISEAYNGIQPGSEVVELKGKKGVKRVLEVHAVRNNICNIGSYVVLDDGQRYAVDAIIPTIKSYEDINQGEKINYTYSFLPWNDCPKQLHVEAITFDGYFLIEDKGITHPDYVEKIVE